MQALRDVVQRHDTHMVAICAICKSQFAKVMPQYGFGMDQILSLHQLVGDALVLGDPEVVSMATPWSKRTKRKITRFVNSATVIMNGESKIFDADHS